MLPSQRLDGRHAFVTGAGRGIGRAAALGLAEAGAGVTLFARSRDELEAVAAEVRRARTGGRRVRRRRAFGERSRGCGRDGRRARLARSASRRRVSTALRPRSSSRSTTSTS